MSHLQDGIQSQPQSSSDIRGAILMTGATGFLGRYLVRDLMQQGRTVALLSRASKDETAQQRMDVLLEEMGVAGDATLPQPVCLEGSLDQPNLGLSEEALQWVRNNCTEILHNAASLTFDTDVRTNEPRKTNLEGTQYLIDLAATTGISIFHDVSTAYVCGLRSDLVREDDPVGINGFRNDYEHTKSLAEKAIKSAQHLTTKTFYRPAIIVGEFESGRTTSYQGPYQTMLYTWVCSQMAERNSEGRWEHPVRINLSGNELRNFVPVDWVSMAIVKGIMNPACHGRTYHLTPDVPVTTAELEATLEEYFGYSGVTFVSNANLPDADSTPAEIDFYKWTGQYHKYMSTEPRFDSTNTREHLGTSCPVIDKAALLRLIDFAVQAQFGRLKKRSRRQSRSKAA